MDTAFVWLGTDWREWRGSNRLSVWYRPELDGGGSFAADWFVTFFQHRYPTRTFRRAFEWCCGPGFIGLAVLNAGICEHLTLADVNEQAIESVRRTLRANPALAERVSVYRSDNLDGLPASERFDLVVANPPYATNGNPHYSHDRRTNDPNWSLHARFFGGIRPFLDEDALLCISEFAPLEAQPEADRLPSGFEQWDLRARAPIEELLPMIRKGGLRLREVVNATGDTPPMRLVDGMRSVAIQYADWFWILVIDVPPAER
jgi:hypothetical protein